MADQNLNIGITSTGASEAASGLNAITQGFGQVKAASQELQSNFSQPFQHAGLYLFSRQVLGLAGLSDVARHAMGAITVAMESVAGAAGLTVAAIAPYLLLIGAGIIVFEKWKKSHEDQAKALDQLAKSQQTAADSTTTLIEKLKTYDGIVGALPAHLQTLLKAEEDLQKVQTTNLAATYAQQIETARQKKQADQEALTSAQEELRVRIAIEQSSGATGWAAQKNWGAAEEARKKVQGLKDDITAQNAAMANAQAQLDSYAKSHKNLSAAIDDATKSAKDAAQASDILKNARAAQSAAIDQLTAKEATSAAQISAAQESSIFKHLADIQTAEQREVESINHIVAARTRAIEKEKTDQSTKEQMLSQLHSQAASARAMADVAAAAKSTQAWASFFGAQQTLSAVGTEAMKSAFNGVTNVIGQSFASMVVDGKNFFDSFNEGMKNLAKQFIAAVTEMMIKWAALKAMMGMGFGGAGLVGGSSLMETATFAASGYEGVVDRPALFIAGEAGAERVSIAPLSGGGADRPAGGMNGGTNIGSIAIEVNVSGVNDPNAIADQVGLAIIRKIRGTGQLNFLRAA